MKGFEQKETSEKDSPRPDPLSAEFSDLVNESKSAVRREVFDLESTEKILLDLAMDKDSGLTPDSKLSDVL